METTYNELPAKAKRFLTQLSDYLGIPLLYYGSIQRADFFEGHSDIDVDVFTDNEDSTLNMMQQFMKRPSYKFKKVAWRLHDKIRKMNSKWSFQFTMNDLKRTSWRNISKRQFFLGTAR